MKQIVSIAILALVLSSCTAVKEYEKVNINDPDMALNPKKSDRVESNFHVYREGA